MGPWKHAQVQAAQSEALQAKAEARQAMQQLAEKQAEAQRLSTAHEALIQESSQKASRLARLEGTPSLLSHTRIGMFMDVNTRPE